MEKETYDRFHEIIDERLSSFAFTSNIVTMEMAMELYNAGICFFDSWRRYEFHILPLMVGKSIPEFISIVRRLDIKSQHDGFCKVYLKE